MADPIDYGNVLSGKLYFEGGSLLGLPIYLLKPAKNLGKTILKGSTVVNNFVQLV